MFIHFQRIRRLLCTTGENRPEQNKAKPNKTKHGFNWMNSNRTLNKWGSNITALKNNNILQCILTNLLSNFYITTSNGNSKTPLTTHRSGWMICRMFPSNLLLSFLLWCDHQIILQLMSTSMKNYRYQRAKHLSKATQYTQYTLLDIGYQCKIFAVFAQRACMRLIVPFLLSIPSFSNCVYVYTRVPLLLFACIMFSHFHFPLSTFWHLCTSGTLSNVTTIWLQLWLYV